MQKRNFTFRRPRRVLIGVWEEEYAPALPILHLPPGLSELVSPVEPTPGQRYCKRLILLPGTRVSCFGTRQPSPTVRGRASRRYLRRHSTCITAPADEQVLRRL